MSSTKRRWFVAGALALGLLVALAGAELSVRLLRPLFIPQFAVEENGSVLRPDPVFGFVVTPGSRGHDAWGFKNDAVPTTTDIVALGDSHTYGIYGTHVDWPHILASTTEHSVQNMGVWGYGPVEYLGLLPKALSLHPKVVVVAVYLGNDVFNAYDAAYHRDSWKDLRDPGFSDATPVTARTFKETHIAFRGLRDFVRAHSALYKLVGDGTRLLREEVGLASPRTVGTRDWSTGDPDASLIFDAVPAVKTKFWSASRIKGVDLSRPEIGEGLAVTKRVFLRMRAEAAAGGARLIIVLIPSKEEVYAPLVKDAGLANADFDASVRNESRIREDLLDFCRTHALSCADGLPELTRRVAQGTALYRYHWDEHPAPSGYEVYADIVGRALDSYFP